jgi:type IV pilus assembly protein PilP
MKLRTIAIALSVVTLAACSGEQHSDLRQFVKDSENLPRGRIPPLPEVKPYEAFSYDAFDLLDPFVARKIEPPKGIKVAGGIEPPDPDRRKEPLEAYPLENLEMVGTLNQKKQFHALVKTPDNNLFRVTTGNFMGQNFGRIISISESTIQLKELVQDSSGEWKEEERTMLLQD